ncbi:hypothetical protein MMC12_004127 [Toensbergia leucococca]|nr:hypothetical protein [Toensbergia leucococca]
MVHEIYTREYWESFSNNDEDGRRARPGLEPGTSTTTGYRRNPVVQTLSTEELQRNFHHGADPNIRIISFQPIDPVQFMQRRQRKHAIAPTLWFKASEWTLQVLGALKEKSMRGLNNTANGFLAFITWSFKYMRKEHPAGNLGENEPVQE